MRINLSDQVLRDGASGGEQRRWRQKEDKKRQGVKGKGGGGVVDRREKCRARVCQPKSLSVYRMSVCLFISLSVCLFVSLSSYSGNKKSTHPCDLNESKILLLWYCNQQAVTVLRISHSHSISCSKDFPTSPWFQPWSTKSLRRYQSGKVYRNTEEFNTIINKWIKWSTSVTLPRTRRPRLMKGEEESLSGRLPRDAEQNIWQLQFSHV